MNIERFRIAQFGPRLGTRMEGEHAREQLFSLLCSLPDTGQVRLSLEGIDVLSTSFADELIGKTLHQLTIGELGDRTLILETPVLDLADGIDAKLAQRQLAMLCLTNDSWHLVGAHTQAMSETLGLIIDRGQTTAKELAGELGLQMNACVNRVARLAKLHLIRREQVGMSGPQAIYSLHSILSD
jgi:hypothetical protein